MSRKFLTDTIVRSTEMPAVAANRLAADIIDAIKGEIIGTGRLTLPDFGAFVVRETPKRTALNPRTGRPMHQSEPALQGARRKCVILKKGKRV